jgi:hypothetical protein
MRRGTLRNSACTLAAFGIAVALAACGSSENNDPNAPGTGTGPAPTDTATTPPTPEEQVQQILDQRKFDYGEAARTAKLKLNDELPTLDEINQIGAAPDDAAKKVVYEGLVDKWMADPKFAAVMVKFWKDTFRTAQVGTIQTGQPDKDKAANFAAQVVVNGRPYSDILTATTNTCPSFGVPTGSPAGTPATFTDGSCATTPTVGVLTDPGIQAQYFANMAFRRVRFIQETFACQKMPAEIAPSDQVKPLGQGTYTNPWPFEGLMGKLNDPKARIDFQDTQAVICANCHNTMNRMAPLFINYDDKGVLQTTPQVEVPVVNNPKADPKDYLVAGQPLAWRFGKTITDIPSLGAAMVADPEVQRCAVNRVWNYAMSRGDIVNDLATVPPAITAGFLTEFQGNGMNLREIMRGVFKTDDFVKF